ncbi:MAG: hypothetical protein IT372_19540 [Polyangiaceae bacterium]|nr:hypothetical protein [Polyangiaceae bacterium]
MQPRRHTLLASLLALAASASWAACTQDFDQFASLGGPGQGGGATTTTTTTTTTTSTSGTGGAGEGGAGAAGGGGVGGQGGTAPACGDGVVDPGEQCDDGNTTSGDFCSATCAFEGGDTCPGPNVPLTPAGLELTGDTTGVANDTGQAPCGGGSSGDLVYVITPSQSGSMTATLDGPFSTLLYARSSCPGTNGDNLQCSPTHSPAVLTMPVTADTPFYLFVDGYGVQPEEGPFTLTLELN